jgi:hypothetical protein
MGGHERPNIAETQYLALVPKLCEMSTRNDLSTVTCHLLKSFLVLIEQLPDKSAKKFKEDGNLLQILASPLIKFVHVSVIFKCF